MKRLGDHAAELLDRRHQERTALLRRIGEAHSATSFVAKAVPALSQVIPADVTPDAIADHARWELEAANRRARTCARCPATGGECDGATGYYPEGSKPKWIEGRLEPVACEKWEPYRERRLLDRAGVPAVFLDASFANYKPQTAEHADGVESIIEYARATADGDGGSLVLEGDTGLGKTHLAVAAARVVSRKRPRLAFAYVPEFLEVLRLEATHQDASGAFEDAATSDLLVLDDLGAERATDFAREKLEHLINRRWTERRPMIVTQNVPFESLEELLGAPLVRRLGHATTSYVELRGEAYKG